jgi:hypothetical protein
VLANIVNLIDHRRSNGRIKVIRFKTQAEFSEYTMNGCTYPRGRAKSNGFVKALLREL